MIGLGALFGLGLASSALQGAMNYGMQKDSQAFNAAQADLQRQWASSENQANREFNSQEALNQRNWATAEAQKNRDWESMMSNTAYQRQVADMRAAGLNVGAIGSGSGASTPSGGVFGGSSASASGSAAASAASSAASGVSMPSFGRALSELLDDHSKEFLQSFRAHSVQDALKHVRDVGIVLDHGDFLKNVQRNSK